MKIVNCYNCNKEINITPSRVKNKYHHCSKFCLGITSSKLYSEKIKTECVVCKKEILYKQSHFKKIANHTCSVKCLAVVKSENNKGKNNPKSLKLTGINLFFHNKITYLRNGAKARGLEFSLTIEDLVNQYNKQNKVCFYSGGEFAELKKQKIQFNTLSVDRFDSNKGYIKDNIVLCLNCINMLKSNFCFSKIKSVFKNIYMKEKSQLKLHVKKLYKDSIIPVKGTNASAGYDLYVNRIEEEDNFIKVYTGISVRPDIGFFLNLVPRSSIYKKGLTLYNNLGIIDQDFCGEIVGIFLKTKDFKSDNIKIGDRVLQLVPQEQHNMEIIEVDNIGQTDRGTGSFGSTGI